jgi:hypothetical protein
MKETILYLIRNRQKIARILYTAAAILDYLPERTQVIVRGQKQLRGRNLGRKRDVER